MRRMSTSITPEPGVYDDVHMSVYQSWDATSSHDLINVLRSPLHYKYRREADRGEPTPAMRLGTAAHAYTLQPGEAHREVAVLPTSINRRTKVGKEEYALFVEESKGMCVLSYEENLRAQNMADSVLACPAAANLLKHAPEREMSLLWNDPDTGLVARGRPDAFGSEFNVIVDLKTTADARPGMLASSVAKYMYHVQAYAYRTGLTTLGRITDDPFMPCSYIIIAVESTAPYAVGVYSLSARDIELGGRLYRRAAIKLKQCVEAGSYPGYAGDGDDIPELNLPEWAHKEDDRDSEAD